MTNLTIAHFTEEKNHLYANLSFKIISEKMSEIEGTLIKEYLIRIVGIYVLDLVQRINDKQNANLKENEIAMIQDRTHF